MEEDFEKLLEKQLDTGLSKVKICINNTGCSTSHWTSQSTVHSSKSWKTTRIT